MKSIAKTGSYNFFLLLAAFAALLGGCATPKNPQDMTVDEIYSQAMFLLKDEDYLESKKYFDLIKLQYPASQYADDAQYYLAEISYLREEYILSAFNFNYLRRVYPSSEYARLSLYKTGLCYYNLSPKHDRDQEYTKKAISSFLEFLMLYPNDSLKTEIEGNIKELRNRSAEREFAIAELYRKLDSPNSSIIYYDFVIQDYDDTDYFEQAYFGKIECLVQVRRFDDASQLITLYKRKFPAGKYLNELDAIEAKIRK